MCEKKKKKKKKNKKEKEEEEGDLISSYFFRVFFFIFPFFSLNPLPTPPTTTSVFSIILGRDAWESVKLGFRG